MNTKNYLIVGTVLTVLAGFAGLAQADTNKHAAYRHEVEATKGTTATATAPTHLNRYARGEAEKSSLGGTILSSQDMSSTAPKNFRNRQ